jgi:hypothetical protein
MKIEAQCAEPVSLTFHSALRKRNTEPSIGTFYHISVHLATQFQRRIISRNRPNQKQELPMVAMFVSLIGTTLAIFYNGTSIDAFYQDTVHLPKQFQRRRFF